MPDPGVLAVVYGGPSAEHEVSCVSARRIVATALQGGFSVRVLGLTHDKRWVDADRVLKDVDDVDALPSPDDLLLQDPGAALGLPLFVKPANLGSSIGVAKAADAAALGDAVLSAFEFDDHVILEEFVVGRELELALLGNEDVRVSRAGEIIASREFYDYEDKYVLGLAETVAPTDLKDSQLDHARRVALAAYRALRVEGLARVDIFLRDDEEIVVNEVNTMPGLTPISMFPLLWEAEGLSFAAVLTELVGLARARHARRQGLRTHRLA